MVSRVTDAARFPFHVGTMHGDKEIASNGIMKLLTAEHGYCVGAFAVMAFELESEVYSWGFRP